MLVNAVNRSAHFVPVCRNTSDPSFSSSPTVKQPQINIITEIDGAQQSTVQALSPSSPGHKRSMSDSTSSLPIPESSMESKKSSSLQDVNQDTPCNDVSGCVFVCVCVCVCVCVHVCACVVRMCVAYRLWHIVW